MTDETPETFEQRASFLGEEAFLDKRSAGRPKDLVDVEALERLRAKKPR